jgi:hypothetical protein
LVGVRSVGTAPGFAAGTITDLFFAGFAATGKAASTHNEPNVARMQSAAAIGGLLGMATSPPERL